MRTIEYMINYCNERIEGLQHEHDRSTNTYHKMICLAKQDAFAEIVRTAGYKPRGE